MSDYADFIRSKSQECSMHGFEPTWMPDMAFDFQRHHERFLEELALATKPQNGEQV